MFVTYRQVIVHTVEIDNLDRIPPEDREDYLTSGAPNSIDFLSQSFDILSVE